MHSPLHFAIITLQILVDQWNICLYSSTVHFFQNIRTQYHINKIDNIILRVALVAFRWVTKLTKFSVLLHITDFINSVFVKRIDLHNNKDYVSVRKSYFQVNTEYNLTLQY